MSESIETMISRLTERQRHEFALACARRVQHLMTDPRSVAALDTRERWLRGEATDEEIAAAAAAADAAWAAAYAAAAAADAAWAAAETASAAAETALAASWAASAASWAASDASWAAAAAASAAADAAWAAADAAWAAAWDGERAWQREELERMLKEGGGA